MAQPFEARLATGLRSHAQNCETLRGLITETEAERQRQLALERQTAANAVDVLLNPGERDEAAVEADRARRLAQGYADAIEKLSAKLEAKLASERRQAEQAERDGAIAERDELAARFADELPKAFDAVIDLFRAVEANAARLKSLRIYERDAEAQARNVPGNYTNGSTPIDRFTSMKIPAWSGSGRAWPLDPAAAQREQIAEEERRARLAYEHTKSPEGLAAKERAAAAEDAKWRRYRVSHSKPGFVEVDCRTGRAALLSVDRQVLQMTEEQVAAARSRGAQVEPTGEDDRSSLLGNLTLSAPL